MSWSIGYDTNWKRDIGYGVPAYCDHPDCNKTIDRGLAYVCCASQPYGGEHGCGLYFCEDHAKTGEQSHMCERCANEQPPFQPKPEHPEWINWKLIDESWQDWRTQNPEAVKNLSALCASVAKTPNPHST